MKYFSSIFLLFFFNFFSSESYYAMKGTLNIPKQPWNFGHLFEYFKVFFYFKKISSVLVSVPKLISFSCFIFNQSICFYDTYQVLKLSLMKRLLYYKKKAWSTQINKNKVIWEIKFN
jgi:hypothetical protein